MAGTWTTEKFPQFANEIRRLTEKHRHLDDEPLHLAVAYLPGPPRDQQDIYLLEVIGGMGESSPDRELFETTFEPNGRLQSGFNQRLHMTLTTPVEFKESMEENWKSTEEIVNSVRAGDYQVLFEDNIGAEILNTIKKAAENQEVATHE